MRVCTRDCSMLNRNEEETDEHVIMPQMKYIKDIINQI